MNVLLVNPRGFCAGVNMAIRCLDLVIRRLGPPVYVYHEIVHNRHVVAEFRDRGAVFVNHLDEVPYGEVLVFSAHGVSPAVRLHARAMGLQTIDATCPLVAKVHAEALRFARQGYTILLIGHAGHDEVVGVVGEAPESVRLVESLEDVENLTLPPDSKLAWLSQTTLSVDETARIVSRLEERFTNIEGPPKDDICYATQNRQQALRDSCEQADVVIVVGSHNSSNSSRLAELATKHRVKAHLIDDASQLNARWFRDDQTVVVTAGASTPEDAVQGVADWLVDHFRAEVVDEDGVGEGQFFPLPKAVRGNLFRMTTRERGTALA